MDPTENIKYGTKWKITCGTELKKNRNQIQKIKTNVHAVIMWIQIKTLNTDPNEKLHAEPNTNIKVGP